jgi:K+:H+ antiporter
VSPVAPVTVLIVAVVIAVAWAAGRLAGRLGQPPVVGELAAGIMLGPSVFGLLAPELSRAVFTDDVRSAISTIATGAILVFMFLIGLELDVGVLRRHAHGVARIAAVSLIVPFTFGCLLAIWIFPSLGGEAATRLTFTLFLGIAMSITAMPVLIRVLADLRMIQTTLGTMAIGCAAIDDVVAWTLLGIVVGLVRGEPSIAMTLVLTVAYLAAMFLVVRPLLKTLAGLRSGPGGRAPWTISVVLLAVLSAVVTEHIGLHAVFGVFLFGACVPRQTHVLAGLEHPIRRLSVVLLPAFFVLIGLRTDVGSAGGAFGWTMLVILACAIGGKFGASAIAARTTGLGWREALVIGALLDTRGLVELVALDLGRRLLILSPPLFTMLVVMTFVTTLATAPVVRWLRSWSPEAPSGHRRPPMDSRD